MTAIACRKAGSNCAAIWRYTAGDDRSRESRPGRRFAFWMKAVSRYCGLRTGGKRRRSQTAIPWEVRDIAQISAPGRTPRAVVYYGLSIGRSKVAGLDTMWK